MDINITVSVRSPSWLKSVGEFVYATWPLLLILTVCIVVGTLASGCGLDIAGARFSCGVEDSCQAGFKCCADGYCAESCESAGGEFDGGSGDGGGGGEATEWTDSTSGLTWQVTPSGVKVDLAQAVSYCNDNGWRVPTISELRSLIRDCPTMMPGGACGVSDTCSNASDTTCLNDACKVPVEGCTPKGPTDGCYWPPELKGPCDYYMSQTTAGSCGSWSMFFVWPAPTCGGGTVSYVRCVK